jgi:hypothetical protein
VLQAWAFDNGVKRNVRTLLATMHVSLWTHSLTHSLIHPLTYSLPPHPLTHPLITHSLLQTVVWPGCKWKPLGLGDVLSPKQVKLAYRKAMLVVHTDK